MVAGGKLLIDSIVNSKNFILPLDSEHFSLFNLLPDRKNINKYISKVYLTASGGPFYFDKNFNINTVTLKSATKHPIWKMGFKNSIDSSNLVNKILECFELSSLYNIPLSNIGITISPKAFAHSVVFYADHRISINCFENNMMIPLTSPFSSEIYYKKPKDDINIINCSDLNFIKFNNKNFQIHKHLKKIFNFSQTEQILFMMLNAESVNRFIANKITYSQIIPFIFNNIKNLPNKNKFKNLYEIINYTNMVSTILKKL